MFKLLIVLLIGLFGLGFAQEAAPAETTPSWIIWMDGTTYTPEWSYAVQGVLMVMKPGEVGVLQASGVQHRFVRSQEGGQLDALIALIRPGLEREALNYSQLNNEMASFAWAVAGMDVNAVQNYINLRKQVLDKYSEGQMRFWKALEAGLVNPGARLVVLVQQFDVPAVSRQTLTSMMETRLRDWVMPLQDTAPWEEKTDRIKAIAEKMKAQNSRVDGFYIKPKTRTIRGGVEVSKALFSGVSRLCKTSGGKSQNLKGSEQEIVAALNK